MKINLPFPPTVNQLYATNWKTKRRFPSKKYKEWIPAAKEALGRPNRFWGRVTLSITLAPPDLRKRDLDNYAKAAIDFLVSQGIIEDDSLVMELHMKWLPKVKGGSCEIIITNFEEK